MKPLTQDPPTGQFLLDGRREKPPARILCVEDNEGDYHLFRIHLEGSPLKPMPSLTRARSTAEALAHVRTFHANSLAFDLIILDLSLPDSTGTDSYSRIRDAAPETAIVILSGRTDHELAIQMVQQGAQDYLPKDTLSGDLLGRSLLYALERQRARIGILKLNQKLQRTSVELRTAQMHLIQAEKLESLGRLAAGVAHEVKNPLGVLQMGVDYFRNKTGALGPNAESIVDHMQDAITRADTIIREMLDFSRSNELSLVKSDINELVMASLRMVHHEMLKRKVQLVDELTNGLPAVRVDVSKLEQVLINLIINGAQAMPAGGQIFVRTFLGEYNTSSRDEGARDLERLRTGDEVVVIEIRDHGTGIPTDIFSRIFEPFFTTKPSGEGTGLGLAVARRIVELHRGRLQITNMNSPQGVRARIVLRPDFSDAPITAHG